MSIEYGKIMVSMKHLFIKQLILQATNIDNLSQYDIFNLNFLFLLQKYTLFIAKRNIANNLK